MPEHRRGLPRAQHVAVLDAVSAQGHRRKHRHHLAPRIRAARAVTEIHSRIDERLDPQTFGEQRWEHHAGVGDRPLVIEHHDRRVVHHADDLPSGAATGAICRYQALLGRSLHPITRMERWIEAKAGRLSLRLAARRQRQPGHDVGRVLRDLTVMVADGKSQHEIAALLGLTADACARVAAADQPPSYARGAGGVDARSVRAAGDHLQLAMRGSHPIRLPPGAIGTSCLRRMPMRARISATT